MIDFYIFNGGVAEFNQKYLDIGGFDNYFLRIRPKAEPENVLFLVPLIGKIIINFILNYFIKIIVQESNNG